MPNLQQYCTFEVDHMLLGVPVKHVQEVLRFQEITAVPLAPRSVRGLLNLRGHIVVALDLRRRLGLADRPASQLPMNVVMQSADRPVSLLVDEIGDMVEVDDDCFESPPENLMGLGRELIVGTYKLPRRLLLALDPEKTIDLANETSEALA